MAAKKNEWVKPLWASRLSSASSHEEVMKSISGRLLAIAPIHKDLRPIFLPATASPIQPPSTIWVNESKVGIGKLKKCHCSNNAHFQLHKASPCGRSDGSI